MSAKPLFPRVAGRLRGWSAAAFASISLPLFAISLAAAAPDAPALSLAGLFKDHVVLQRSMDVPIWGTARPGDAVTVSFGGKSVETTAGDDGKWMVELPPMPASKEGRVLKVESSSGGSLEVKDVLVGDVWLCSGQSNMEFSVSQAKDAEREIAAANYPGIRCFKFPKTATFKPSDEILGEWAVCSPETVGDFSAVAYYFARELLKDDPNVPIGLVSSNWGGTPAESWTSLDTLKARPALFADLLKRRAYREKADAKTRPTEENVARYRKALAEWEASTVNGNHQYPPVKDSELEYVKPGFDCSKWKKMDLPGAWESRGLNIDGVVWFRRSVVLPFDWEGKDLLLSFGSIDDRDTTFWNGEKIGETGPETPRCWSAPRNYTVPGKLVLGGKNTIAVRVFDGMGGGGFTGKSAEMFLKRADGAGKAIPLDGNWCFKVEAPMPEKPANPMAKRKQSLAWLPGGLYDAMIHPLIPMAFTGVIWYQGEANAGNPKRAKQYQRLFMDMITCWRKAWKRDFPFYFVQLANFQKRQTEPAKTDSWAILRDSQTMALKLPNTGMAVIIDIGSASTIHPKNKQEVGRRLALAARKNLRGEDLVAESPMFDSMKVDGSKIVVKFKNAGGGLKLADGAEKIEGFAIAGADQRFRWADARIISPNEVELTADGVKWPVAVRYAWHKNPKGNLVGGTGLPACPFRTDDW